MSESIKELYKIEEKDYERAFAALEDAMADYPKLQFAFPDPAKRVIAINMCVRAYGIYDLKFGSGYSLDAEMNEVIAFVHSDCNLYTDEMFAEADSFGKPFQELAAGLTEDEVDRWFAAFNEIDRLEADLNIETPHIYVDFVGVRKVFQRQKRGTRLIRAVCDYADELGIPVMLFTNSAEDIAFYKSNGFRIIGYLDSEEFGIHSTYLMYGGSMPEVADVADASAAADTAGCAER